MRKTYTTKDGGKIRKVGRMKKIYFGISETASPYFMWGGRRQSLDEIPALHYPVMYEDEAGKVGAIGGYITLCNWGGVLVEIDPNGEAVQLWEEIEA